MKILSKALRRRGVGRDDGQLLDQAAPTLRAFAE
jgi:hypothetical protein